jgi:hypothetical protein
MVVVLVVVVEVVEVFEVDVLLLDVVVMVIYGVGRVLSARDGF